MSSYSVEVKPSARRELEAVPDNVLPASFCKWTHWAGYLAPQVAKNSRAIRIYGGFEPVIGG